jgi:hypothetical protein
MVLRKIWGKIVDSERVTILEYWDRIRVKVWSDEIEGEIADEKRYVIRVRDDKTLVFEEAIPTFDEMFPMGCIIHRYDEQDPNILYNNEQDKPIRFIEIHDVSVRSSLDPTLIGNCYPIETEVELRRENLGWHNHDIIINDTTVTTQSNDSNADGDHSHVILMGTKNPEISAAGACGDPDDYCYSGVTIPEQFSYTYNEIVDIVQDARHSHSKLPEHTHDPISVIESGGSSFDTMSKYINVKMWKRVPLDWDGDACTQIPW